MSESSQVPQALLDAILEIPTRAMLTPELAKLAGDSSVTLPVHIVGS